ncbi:hypothetical protein QEN19_001066 [Hanseniaspora menglaensis]
MLLFDGIIYEVTGLKFRTAGNHYPTTNSGKAISQVISSIRQTIFLGVRYSFVGLVGIASIWTLAMLFSDGIEQENEPDQIVDPEKDHYK